MGEIAEMMLDGTLCERCGSFIGEATGFPRICNDCKLDTIKEEDFDFREVTQIVKECIEQTIKYGTSKQKKSLKGMLYKYLKSI